MRENRIQISTQLPKRVEIVEVGPRDGLQNEARKLAIDQKLALIGGLARAGVSHIEAGSFVNPRRVPQMADSDAVFTELSRHSNDAPQCYTALIPNLQGYQRAIDAGARSVAVFCSASETFSQKNTNCSIEESLQRFQPVLATALRDNIPVRAYLSCVVGCPYEGEIAPSQVLELAVQLRQMGCYQACLADTTGVGTAGQFAQLLSLVQTQLPADQLAIHCHDTYGQALANIYAALQLGVSVIDSSVAGLGGCPFAAGASGNVATEDLVYMLHGMGIETGINLSALIETGNRISAALGRPNQSKVARALSNT